MTPSDIALVVQYGMIVLAWLMLALAALRYAFECGHLRMPWIGVFRIRTLAWLSLAAHLIYAAALTGLQYWLWSEDALARILLEMPANGAISGVTKIFPSIFNTSWGYFLFYSWGRFWLHALLSVVAALVFWWFLRMLARYQERFFVVGETDIGLLAALVVGWPHSIILVPLVFVGVVLVSALRFVVWKERYTTLGWPLLCGAAATLCWGPSLITLLGLAVLRA